MTFQRLDLLWIILPLMLLVFLMRHRKKTTYFSHPLLFYLRGKIRPASRLVHLPRWLEIAALGLLAVAVLDPTVPAVKYLIRKQGLDILMVLDLSASMQEPIDRRGAWERRRLGIRAKEKTRLDAVKEAMIGFVQKRKGDRIGVVVFSEKGYVVSPLTVDTAYLTQYLKMVDNKTLAGEGQTAIGEGLHTAYQLASRQNHHKNGRGSKDKVIVVLTDGENNSGRDVYAAIQKAAEGGFKIHFIGVELDQVRGSERLVSAVRASGGNYYDVNDSRQLAQVHENIGRLETGTFLTSEEVTHVPRYHPLVLASLILLSAGLALHALPYFIEIS